MHQKHKTKCWAKDWKWDVPGPQYIEHIRGTVLGGGIIEEIFRVRYESRRGEWNRC